VHKQVEAEENFSAYDETRFLSPIRAMMRNWSSYGWRDECLVGG